MPSNKADQWATNFQIISTSMFKLYLLISRLQSHLKLEKL